MTKAQPKPRPRPTRECWPARKDGYRARCESRNYVSKSFKRHVTSASSSRALEAHARWHGELCAWCRRRVSGHRRLLLRRNRARCGAREGAAPALQGEPSSRAPAARRAPKARARDGSLAGAVQHGLIHDSARPRAARRTTRAHGRSVASGRRRQGLGRALATDPKQLETD